MPVSVSVKIPVRTFDQNQGEKLCTQRDIDRNRRLLDATQIRVRDNIGFSCQNGCASLLDFLNARSEYRRVQISCVNLIGAYLTAASPLNFAAGQEVIP
ncbi:MAG: hypothetical protein ACLP6G_15000 [Terriglobales bacterium]